MNQPQGATQSRRTVDVSAGQRVKTIATVIIEMIPSPVGYGPGDVITVLEGIFGRTIDGLKLTTIERLVYFGASAIPGVPARPIVAAYRWTQRKEPVKQITD